MKERALLLSGGAFRGAVQLPVIEKLFQEYQYDAVYGVSVGSINGAMFSQHELYELRMLWDSVDGTRSFLSSRFHWPFKGLYSMKPLRSEIESRLSLDKIKIPFSAGVVSGTTGEYITLFSENMEEDLQLWDAIQSSSCMAGIMAPCEFTYNNKTHIGFDGGYRSIIPVPTDEFNNIDIVTCTPLDRMKMKMEFKKKDIVSLMLRGIEIFEDGIFTADLSKIKNSNAKHITVYAPSDYPGNSLDANREIIEYRYKLGELAYYNPIVLK